MVKVLVGMGALVGGVPAIVAVGSAVCCHLGFCCGWCPFC
jgi:hypothetical protein